MIEKITLDNLNKDNVSVKKQQYIQQGEILYAVDQPWRRAYTNSIQGRLEVQNELPAPQQNAIFAIWGDAPTVEENTD